MSRRNYLYCAVALVMLAFLANDMHTGPQVVAQTNPTATPIATESDPIPPELLIFGPGPFDLQATAGLADLSSYQASLRIAFKGKQGGQAAQWTETFDLLVSAEPAARALTATFKGKAPAAEYVPLWTATMNGVAYQHGPDGACIGSVIDERAAPAGELAPPVWEPATFLPTVLGAEEAGSKKISGVAAKGYKFDERALGAANRAQATGEVWIADAGGYVVKYDLTVKGDAAYFGEGGEGTLTWTYALTKAGQPVAVKLMKDCPEGVVNAPMLDNAQDVERYPGVTVYKTPSAIAEAADFYQKALPNAGWEVSSLPILQEDLALLSFKQGTAELTVMITADGNGALVRLTFSSQAQ